MYPVILEATIAGVASGAIRGPADARGLQNRTDKILRINEIRYRLTGASNNALSAQLLATAAAQIRIGNEPITSGLVPILSMTWPIDFRAEFYNITATISTAMVTRFAKPILIAPGQSLNVQVTHRDTTGARFVVSAFCQEATAEDQAQAVTPWITHWLPTPHLDGEGVFEDFSTEADLVNPFDSELFVERLIGRVLVGIPDVHLSFLSEPDRWTSPDGHFSFPFNLVRVRGETSEGIQIIRDPTPFGVVFDFVRKSWVVNDMLAPKGFYRFAILSNFATVVLGATYQIQPHIGMLGYRRVR